MSLLSYEAAVTAIPVGKTSFNVKGLSSDDIGQLISRNLEELSELYAKLENGNPDELAGSIVAAVVAVPRLATSIIVLGLAEDGEPAQLIAQVGKLPMGVQFEALTEISRLTFEDAGGLGKFVEKLKAIMQAGKTAAPLRKSAAHPTA